MRILHVVSWVTFRAGGPIRFVADITAELAARGAHVEVIGLRAAEASCMGEGVSVVTFPFSHMGNFCYCPSGAAWARDNVARFDVVVIHGMWQHLQTAVAKRCIANGVPYVITPHGMLEPWPVRGQGWLKFVKKWLFWKVVAERCFEKASRIYFTTERERRLADGVFSGSKCQGDVIPYCVKTEEVRRDDRCLGSRKPIVLFLGRVHPKKNVELLIRAWAAGGMSGEWELVIAGPCEEVYRKQLDALIAKVGVRRSVRFVGMVEGDKKRQLLATASWFVLPSSQENFAIAALEAIRAGCPVVLSDQVYMGDHLTGAREVLAVEEAAWAEFFRLRMRDEEYRLSVLAANEASANASFDFDVLADKWFAGLNAVRVVK